MIIYYEFLEKLVLSFTKQYLSDLCFDTFFIEYTDMFYIKGTGRYKTMKMRLDATFELTNLVIKNLKGTISLGFIKFDLYTFLKEFVHHPNILWIGNEIHFKFPIDLKIKDINESFIQLTL